MKSLLVVILAISLSAITIEETLGEEDNFFDSVKFVQYLDENTALEEVKNGNLDIYYYRISADRLEESESREGLKVYDSTGGSYSILVNPAESDKFNPFSEKEIRFALNYLVDRKLIVNELMGGFGTPMISYYGPSDPEYLTVVEHLQEFNFRYNPSLAEETITEVLNKKGAIKENGKWKINDELIEITIFIRSDDPVRKSIGEILASELQKIGFDVKKEFGDLNKAFVIVYGSNPADLKWSLYTEGWGRSAFVKYDSVGLGQMYSPWFSNMPGFNDPSYWNYKNEYIDSITQKIYTGDFESEQKRKELIQVAVQEGIKESVRIFLASKIDQYVVNQKIDGIVNDLGAGVPSRFTPINAKGDKEELMIGVKQIYQGAWNPVMGLSDTYSRHIWGIISDPITFKHPFSGMTFPVRADWNVETAGPMNKLDVPSDAKIWHASTQKWKQVGDGTQSTSKVTFDFEFGKWHNGQMMDMNDILHSLYFTIEWGIHEGENDKTFDTEFTPRASQLVQTIKGVKPIDRDTIEVYVDYWHFDKGEIADWAALWSSIPWEISSAMEQAVIDGKISYSRSGATSKNVNWASLIIPKDAKLIQEYLNEFKKTGHVPKSLVEFEINSNYFDSRYTASMQWIQDNNHAVISNGPFFLNSYSPESRTITVSRFDVDSYPLDLNHWSIFEHIEFPKITRVENSNHIIKTEEFTVNVLTDQTDTILLFLSNSKGEVIASESVKANSSTTEVTFPKRTIENLDIGSNDLRIFAISESVLKPDYYATSFFVTDESKALPEAKYEDMSIKENNTTYFGWAIFAITIIIIGIVIAFKKRNKIYANP